MTKGEIERERDVLNQAREEIRKREAQLNAESSQQYNNQYKSATPIGIGLSSSGESAGCGRMTARAAIELEIERLDRKAAALRSLLKALPQELPMHADEALWQLVMEIRR